ncbi:peptidylprolyl isomerase [Verrucomicrobiota bacterium sgz303538]
MKPSPSLCLAVALALAGSSTVFAADAKKNANAKAKEPAAAPAAPAAEATPAAKETPLPATVAVVEGTEIKKEELERAFNAVLSQQGIPAAQVPAEQRAQGYRMILDDLILEKLVSKRSAETKVTDEEVGAMYDRIKSNFGSEDELKAQIQKNGQTVDQVKADIRTSLQQQHWLDEQTKDKVEVSDADAEKFYKENPDQFKKPEQVRASHILVRVEQDAKPEVVVEKEKKAQAIAARVKKGEDFNKVAAEVSEDPSAKENSGDLNFFSKDQMVPEFSNAAFGMKKDEISEPVRSQFGYHIIKVTDRKPAETVTLDQAKPQLVAFLKQQKKQQEVSKVVREIREKADVKINLPQPPAPATPAPDAAPEAPAKK